MKESEFRRLVVRLLLPVGAIYVENTADDGTPDVACVLGWIELKVATRPVRPTTNVAVKVRPSQRVWWQRWRRHGGAVTVLTLLDQTWLLHDGLWAAEHLGRAPAQVLTESAIWTSATEPTSLELIEAIGRGVRR